MSRDWDRLLELVREGIGFSDGASPFHSEEESVWRLARMHKVAPILAPKILDEGHAGSLEEEVRYVWQMAGLREAYYVRQAEEWVGRLRERGIRAFALKGVVLASLVYPRPGQRAFRDLDLLISPPDLKRTHDFLVGKGFVELHPSSPLKRAPRIEGSSMRVAESGMDALSYQRDDLFLELHTRIIPPNLGEYSLERNFDSERSTLDDVDFLVHLLVHTTRHHFLYGLRHLVDIALWMKKRNPPLDVFEERVQSSGLEFLIQPAWTLSHEIFPEAVPPKSFTEQPWVLRYTEKVHGRLRDMPKVSMALSGSPFPFYLMKGKQGEGLFRALFGSRERMEHQTGPDASQFRHLFWKISRPVQLLWRHGPVFLRWLQFAWGRS